jgi:hypothetical protein
MRWRVQFAQDGADALRTMTANGTLLVGDLKLIEGHTTETHLPIDLVGFA